MSGAAMPEWLWTRYLSQYSAAARCPDAELSGLYTDRANALHGEWFA